MKSRPFASLASSWEWSKKQLHRIEHTQARKKASKFILSHTLDSSTKKRSERPAIEEVWGDC